jgi:uncharacterized RDD family membrane protein YckC
MTIKGGLPGKGPGLIRRLIVITYDALLLAGVIFASWVVLFLVLFPLPETVHSHPLTTLLQRCYLAGVAFLFYGWFWVNGGQTLGMRAWRMKLVSNTGENISWRNAALRFFGAIISLAPAAMGFMWVLVDRRNRTWHGMLSGTKMVLLEKSTDGSNRPAH